MIFPWQIVKPFGVFVKTITGRENIPNRHYIVAARHLSSLDTLLYMLALRRNLTFIASDRLLKYKVRKFVVYTIGQSIPSSGGSINRCRQEIEQGKTICIFPQGEIHPNHQTGGINTGVVVLSHLTQLPILPVSISGSDEVWPVTYWPLKPWKFRNVDIAIGQPIDPPTSASLDRDAYILLANQLNGVIGDLGKE